MGGPEVLMATKGKRPSAQDSKSKNRGRRARLSSPDGLEKIRKSNEFLSKRATSVHVDGDRPFSVVGVGASAGGLEAFEQLLKELPADTGMAFVLVQHLAPKHESILSELLAKATKMPVVEVTQGMPVRANHIYVIPPNADMTLDDGILHLSPLNVNRSLRMPIDSFFRSLADTYQNRAVGVILSGTASDGTLGMQAIKAMGGVTFAQDEQSAKYNAMPRNAIAAGSVDFVLEPQAIARELKRISTHAALLYPDDHESDDGATPNETLNKIFILLRNFSRVDFSLYKPGTIKRRITRRMFLRKIDNLEAYFQLLRKDKEEVENLFSDVLINVTGFFRDSEAFDNLKKTAFPAIMNHKPLNSAIRIWVPGCSTGEEVYSIAIVFLEFLGERAANMQIQIFATDLSESIIGKARSGMYPESIAADVSTDRLRRFFQKVDSGYQIHKNIRDIIVFAKQDLTKDPPFSKLDMISCRNVMIYMSQVLQKRILPLFHYALNPGGVLFLGSSETTGGLSDLFVPLDKKYKVYTKKTNSVSLPMDFVPRFQTEERDHHSGGQAVQPPDLQKIGEQMLLYRYSPASVMVNNNLDIVQFIGQTGPFLDPLPGNASLNLMTMVKTGLHMELRVAFQKAKRNIPVRKEGVLVEHNGGLKAVNFEIVPVKNVPGGERYFMVMFEEADRPSVEYSDKSKQNVAAPKKTGKKQIAGIDVENRHLKEELEATREYLQSIIEEQRTTNEELRSANEEIQSSNEELQSINEELETAKEELQSTNEELTTVNEELQNRNDELSKLNSDLHNLLSSVNIPIIMLGNDFSIRRFTPMAGKVMNLIPSDVGRPITDIKPNLKLPDLKQSIQRVIDSLEIQEFRVEDGDGRWYSMRIRPYRTVDNKIDGVVIVLLDIDARRSKTS